MTCHTRILLFSYITNVISITLQRAPGGRATYVTWLGLAGNGCVESPCGPTTYKGKGGGQVRCQIGSGWDGYRRTGPCGTWNVTSLVGKEPEFVEEVERF